MNVKVTTTIARRFEFSKRDVAALIVDFLKREHDIQAKPDDIVFTCATISSWDDGPQEFTGASVTFTNVS